MTLSINLGDWQMLLKRRTINAQSVISFSAHFFTLLISYKRKPTLTLLICLLPSFLLKENCRHWKRCVFVCSEINLQWSDWLPVILAATTCNTFLAHAINDELYAKRNFDPWDGLVCPMMEIQFNSVIDLLPNVFGGDSPFSWFHNSVW